LIVKLPAVGTTISYDASVDSLQNVITRINQSAAGVTALYDGYNDTFSITSDTTGSTAIGLAEVTGNFLTSMGVLGAQTLGLNTEYTINGGATQYATTNQISDAITGVTLTLKETTATAVNIEVFADNGLIAGRIGEFVEQYGVVGSAIGTTDELTFNQATFDAAVASDPSAVRALLTAFDASAALDAGGTGSLASISGKPTAVTDSGTYSILSDVLGNLTVTFAPDNGGTPVVSTGTIAAGGTNTTLISGVTLTAQGALLAGRCTTT
jgi:flagellar hook-associated protein 2